MTTDTTPTTKPTISFTIDSEGGVTSSFDYHTLRSVKSKTLVMMIGCLGLMEAELIKLHDESYE